MKKPSELPAALIRPRTIVFLAAPNTQILDVAGPFQVFVRAAELFVHEHPKQKRPYKVLLASSTKNKAVTTNCGLLLAGTETYRSLRGPIDTLLVAGGSGVDGAAQDAELIRWLRKVATRVRRIGSICTRAFLLGSAGLLDGKRAVTHWKWAGELAARCKLTTVDPEPIYIAYLLAKTGLLAGKSATIHHSAYMDFAMTFPNIQLKRGARFVEDGNLASSGGLSSGIDLAMRVVERYFGLERAEETADMMEYQGRGWLDPNSNRKFAKAQVSTQEHPICPVCSMDADRSLKSVYKDLLLLFARAQRGI